MKTTTNPYEYTGEIDRSLPNRPSVKMTEAEREQKINAVYKTLKLMSTKVKRV